MTLAISHRLSSAARALAADKVGLSEDKICWFDFPVVAGGKGAPTDTLGGITGWLITKGSPKEARRFPEVLRLEGRADAACRRATSSSRWCRARTPASTIPS